MTRTNSKRRYRDTLVVAGLLTAGSWFAGFSIATATAITSLLDPSAGETTAEPPLGLTVSRVLLALLSIVCALAACWRMANARFPWPHQPGRRSTILSWHTFARRGRRLGMLHSPRSLTTGLWVYLIYFAVLLCGKSIGDFLTEVVSPSEPAQYPFAATSSSGYVWGQLALLALAGPTEELLFAATMPLLAFMVIKNKSVALLSAVVVSTVLRVMFHLYYGLPASVGIAFWAATAVLLWWKTGQLLSLVLAHSANNVIAGLNQFSEHFPRWAGDFALILLIAVPLTLALWSSGRRTTWLTPRAVQTPEPTRER